METRVGRSIVLLFLLVVLGCVSGNDSGEYDNCNCDDEEGILSIQNILVGQKVSDFLISIAYFSIPIELLYFVSRSNVPFKLLFLQFIAFIVLCGLTHLLNTYSYHGPPSFQLVVCLTVAKFLTALVSCATALTLPPLIPLLLKVKIRELFLRQNVLELDQEVGMMKKQKETSLHVRMLTREIRKSLDKHTILYTTLVELSKALDLDNCAVWMPDEERREMHLTHELKASPSRDFRNYVPRNDSDVLDIKMNRGVRILRPESALGIASNGGHGGTGGAVAAVRMPMLRVSNFKGGTPEKVETCYALLVLVLPKSNLRVWTNQELEIVEVVADQVAVALSHAFILEESQRMRQKLAEQNRVLQQARKDAMMASQARKAFQKVMSHGMRRPMHSTLGLLSLLQDENMRPEQKIIGNSMLKVSRVLSNLINDVVGISENEKGSFPLDMKPFLLHSMLKEAACIAKCLCVYKGFGLEIDVQKSLPDLVVGDDERALQVILHMIGDLLNTYDQVLFGNSDFTMWKYVQMMQGYIWISPNPQCLPQGMTLLLKFRKAPPLGKSIVAPRDYLNSQFKGLKVVLADDDCVNRIVTKKLLEKLGCQVTAVSSGFECLSAISASNNSFRIILLELHMHDMDGSDVAGRIRNFHKWPLIVALLSSAEEHEKQRCIQVGINGFVHKPVQLHEMADELGRVLQRAGA
ncbi:hypothetical protein Ahy_B09g097234 isoform D [Arachis hypogaea]|uniref:Response regulatory domain-containing protein n=1 Tax=Arachis hypogaea TaxID=3818 RepID=A0A444XNQ4_ARAHY|nr:hypothetical protein Ahy_B09g097234 isoform D [Arachis hypogaea]